MAISCEPSDLMDAANCIDRCVPNGMRGAIMIYLLQQIAENTMTADQLMEQAKCYKCIPGGMQAEVQTMLLCEILKALEA